MTAARAPVTAHIGIGANLGDSLKAVQDACADLGRLPQTRVVATSGLYRSAPVDAAGPDFVNAVVELQTGLTAPELLANLHALEIAAGRTRPWRNAPRTLDLDLLFYGDARIDSATLTVPHPRMAARAFVLRPLAELAPERVTSAMLAAVADQDCAALDGTARTLGRRPPSPSSPLRYGRLDALRGLALVWMTVYHFSYDLNHFGYLQQDFYRDPVWTWQRSAILSLFLFTAGFAQALAVQGEQGWPRFWRRWLQIAGCAALVSLGSWWMFPRSWISFGVLHGLAVMLLLVRALLTRGRLRAWVPWLLAACLIAVTPWLVNWVQAQVPDGLRAVLDSRWFNGLGVVSRKPVTEDYVPLLPWLGVVLLGVGAARLAPAGCLAGPAGWLGRRLAVLGRWSLSWYMLHQPVLIGGLLAWRALTA